MIKIFDVKILVIALIALTLFITSAPHASALRVSGAILQAAPHPGERVNLFMDVGLDKNDSPANIVINSMDWLQTPHGNNLAVDYYPSPYSAKDLLKISPSSIHLEPGESQRVNVVADIPADANVGGKYAILNIHTVSGTSGDGSSVRNEVAINALLALNITGPGIQKTGEISSLEIEEPVAANQLNVSLIFNNTGNIHYKILTEVELKDIDNNMLANATILPYSSVLPGASRMQQIMLVPSKPLRSAVYDVEAKVSLESGKLQDKRSTSIAIGL
ncbi:MAG: hypothetical protein ACP5PV_05965 [Methanothrix sp.]